MNISEVSKITGLTSDTLRYYEKIGLVENIERSPGGKRMYSEQDINHLNFITCMKKAGCSLDVIKRYMSLFERGSETVDERVELLESQKLVLLSAMTELQESIDYLDYKIEHTRKH